MCPVHVKKNAPTFGPGGGAHAKTELTSGVVKHARRFVNRASSIERGAGALVRSGDHIYAPAGASLDQLPGPNEGVVANVSLEMKHGELAVAGAFIGDSWRERYDVGGGDAEGLSLIHI